MRRRLLRKPFVIAGVVVIVAAATGAFVMTRGAAGNVSYRTAAATLGTVTQTVSRVLTISPAGANGCTAGFGGGFGRGGGFGGGFGGGGGGGSSGA